MSANLSFSTHHHISFQTAKEILEAKLELEGVMTILTMIRLMILTGAGVATPPAVLTVMTVIQMPPILQFALQHHHQAKAYSILRHQHQGVQ